MYRDLVDDNIGIGTSQHYHEYLTNFMSKNTGLAWISWIQDVKDGSFDDASMKFSEIVRGETDVVCKKVKTFKKIFLLNFLVRLVLV